MPSKTFQPLLFDSFSYKVPNSTYHDEFKWKRIKDFKRRIESSYASYNKRPTSAHVPSTRSIEAANEASAERHYVSNSNVNFDLNVKEIASRSKSAAPSRNSAHSYTNEQEQQTKQVEEELAELAQRYLKTTTPAATSTKQHWLQYPQDDTPKYITDAKKRLGQIHPRTPPQVHKPESVNLYHQQHVNDVINHHTFNVNLDASQKGINPMVPRHFLSYDTPDTPENIKDIRKRFKDERYRRDDGSKSRNKSAYTSMRPEELSKYISDTIKPAGSIPTPNLQLLNATEAASRASILKRSKSSMGFEKPATPATDSQESYIQKIQIPAQQAQQPITIIYNHFQAPGASSNPTPEYLATLANNISAGTLEQNNDELKQAEERDEEQQQAENQALLSNDSEDLIKAEWDKYYGFVEKHNRRSETPSKKSSMKVTPPTPTLNDLSDQMMNRPQTVMSNAGRKTSASSATNKRPPSVAGSVNANSSKPPLPDSHQPRRETPAPTTFNGWLQTADETEKEIVLNMLKSIDGAAAAGGVRPKSVASEKRAVANSATYGIRTRPPSSKRKLGQTRSLHKFPCEVCEKVLIKKHIWDISKCTNCSGGARPTSASANNAYSNRSIDSSDGYFNITSHFTNSMPTWRGQYIIHPDFTSENKDFMRIHATAPAFIRPKSSKI